MNILHMCIYIVLQTDSYKRTFIHIYLTLPMTENTTIPANMEVKQLVRETMMASR